MSDENLVSVPPAPESSPSEGSGVLRPGVEARSPQDERVRAIAYQQILQSTSKMVEDTSDQLRQLATLSTAASGVALRLMLAGEQTRSAAQTMSQAQQSLQQATAIFQEIGRVSTQFLERLQPAPPTPAEEDVSEGATPKKE